MKGAGGQHKIRRDGRGEAGLEAAPTGPDAVRAALAGGRVNHARRLLGRPFAVDGTVVRGKGLGGPVLSFPTANVRPRTQLLPATGVYISSMRIDGRWHPGVTNVGHRPTVDDGPETIETHLLDFSRDIYGLEVRLCFLSRLRGERKFPSLEALRGQIARDVERARRFFRRSERAAGRVSAEQQ